MPVSFSTGAVIRTDLGPYAPRWIGQTYSVDLDNDGNSDLLVLGATYPFDGPDGAPQPSLAAFGNGDGTFRLADPQQFPFASLQTVHPREVVFADFNGDGFKDVFVADHGYDAMPFPGAQNKLLLSNGDGSWRDASGNLPASSDFTHSAAAGDIDGDGDIDLFVGNMSRPNPTGPYVLLNDGHGSFSRSDALLPTGAGGALHADVRRIASSLLSDLDGDGKADLVAGSAFSTEAHPVQPAVLWNDGHGFANAATTLLPEPANFGAANSTYEIQATDVNFDGRLDLIVAYLAGDDPNRPPGGWELQVLVNQGNRQFADQTAQYLPQGAHWSGLPNMEPESQYWVQFLHLADINQDGRTDFVLDARGITAAPASLPLAFVHQADGTFATATVGELAAAGAARWMFDYSTQFVQWQGGSGFAHFGWPGNSNLLVEVQPVTFAPVLPVLDTDTVPRTLTGGAGDDQLTGAAGGDRLTGNGGDDALDGRGGNDTAIFAGARSGFSVTATPTGLAVHDRSGALGTDSLVNIERVQFDDLSIVVGIGGAARSIAPAQLDSLIELYIAYLARVPDADGMAFWIDQLRSGQTLEQIGEAFYSAALQYPDLTGYSAAMGNADFVTLVYRNVLGRDEPDAEGLAFWSNALASGKASRGTLVAAMLDSAHTFKGDAEFGWVADLLDNKIAVGRQFAIDNGLVYNTPEASIARGMEIAAAVTPDDTAAAIALIGLPDQLVL